MLELVLVNCFSLVPVTSKSLNNMQFKNSTHKISQVSSQTDNFEFLDQI